MRSSIAAVRRLAIAIVAVAALALPVLATTGAGAATLQPLQPQSFTIRQVDNSNGTVVASGPIRGTGTDLTRSNTFDVFVLPRGDVNVYHSDVSNVQPRINVRACTAFASATGRWAVRGGTRLYRNAFGNGTFRFFLYLQLRRLRNGRCDTNLNHQPRSSLVLVFAFGQARR